MEGVSSAAIEVLVQNLINVVKDEYSLIRGLHKEAQQLQKTLGMIQSYLNDAEKKSITHATVKHWLKDLEDSAFDADNVLDELTYHLLRKKVKKETMEPINKVLSCFSSFNHTARQRNMALKIKQVNTDFETKNKKATELGLQSIVMNAPPTTGLHASFETSSVTVNQIFIGRDVVESDIVDQLSEISGEEKISILTIVGMGGMGKTTLTKKVFHHEKIKARFGSRIWVHVSQTFDPILLFKKILSTLTSQTSDGVETKEVVLKRLEEALKSKSYLLILDDIWNEDLLIWEDFIDSMLGATSTMGNWIIMSTRNQNVASLVRPLHNHALKGLSVEECWSIIKAKTFENRQVPSSGFELIGRKIAERCGGLPLAANVVGGTLRCKSEQEWRFISENWLSDDEGGKNISKILKLSFDYLPSPSLKKCFAYCSVFPKGWKIKKQELIEKWMAEGFLLQADGKKEEMESVGEKFINLLLHNSLLQVSDGYGNGNVSTYVMHDLVHDLARSCFNQDRYIYMIYDPNIPIAKESAKCLRTLLLTSDDEISDTMFSDFESLRVLVLDCYSFFGEKLPNSIRKLIHLRLLDISRTRIKELPEWIGELHHLQTLRAQTHELRKLPGTLQYLINLRHLYISSGVELPANIGRLTCLQTLTHFNVGDNKGGYGIEQLGKLKNLKGELEIRNLERVHDKEDALKADIYHKPNLLELVFKWAEDREGETNDDEGVLEGLQPHAGLNKLKIIEYKGKRFPSWTQKMAVRDGPRGDWVPLNNLIELKLFWCSECEEIPMLGHLPNLKSLYLSGLKKVRFINSSFNKLTKLHVEILERLECFQDWLFYNNPNLEDLRIVECPKLRELPDGLHTLTSLECLDIRDCPNLKSIVGNNNIPGGGSLGGGGLLRLLYIERCGELVELPRQMMEYWAPSLETLELKELRSLQNLPMLIDCLAKSAARLKRLTIVGVPKFMASSSSSVESWPCGSLWYIEIDVSVEWSRESSGSIKETVEAMLKGCPNSLVNLEIKGRIDWDWLPASIQYLVSLHILMLENIGVEELPQWLGNLSSLEELYLSSCNKLRRLPPGDAYKALTELVIRDCPELEVDSEWRNIPRLSIYVDDREIN